MHCNAFQGLFLSRNIINWWTWHIGYSSVSVSNLMFKGQKKGIFGVFLKHLLYQPGVPQITCKYTKVHKSTQKYPKVFKSPQKYYQITLGNQLIFFLLTFFVFWKCFNFKKIIIYLVGLRRFSTIPDMLFHPGYQAPTGIKIQFSNNTNRQKFKENYVIITI